MRHSFEEGVRELQFRHRLRQEIAGPEGQINQAFRHHLESGALVAFGSPGDVTAPMQHIPCEVWTALRVVKHGLSVSQEDRDGPGRFAAVRVYPVLGAPNVVDLIAGRPLIDVFRKFILRDPEVAALGTEAIEVDPIYRRLFEDGHCHPQGGSEWSVHGDGPLPLLSDRTPSIWHDLLRDPVPAEVSKAANALTDRFVVLLDLLRRGLATGRGLPKSGFPPIIPPSVWNHREFYLDLQKGDLLEVNEHSQGDRDLYLKRWTAIMLERPVSELSKNGNRQRSAAPVRLRPRSDEVIQAAEQAGIDLYALEIGAKQIAREIASLLTRPARTEKDQEALAQVIRRLRRKPRR